VPWIFADPERVEPWRRELAPVPEFKVGINWQGNTKEEKRTDLAPSGGEIRGGGCRVPTRAGAPSRVVVLLLGGVLGANGASLGAKLKKNVVVSRWAAAPGRKCRKINLLTRLFSCCNSQHITRQRLEAICATETRAMRAGRAPQVTLVDGSIPRGSFG
jgi:hypothetical protein